MENYYAAALKFFNNTKELKVGDIVIAFPDPIDKMGMENRIRRAVVIGKDSQYIKLLDLDNEFPKEFIWENNCKIRDKKYLTFLVE